MRESWGVSDIQDIIFEIIDYIKIGSKTYENEINIFIATIACYSSVRFGDQLDRAKMQKLIVDLKNFDLHFQYI